MYIYNFESTINEVEGILGRKIDANDSDFHIPELKIELNRIDATEKIKFKNNKIYHELEDGTLIQGYIIKLKNYNKPYYDREVGYNSILPKFHTSTCKTIVDMKSRSRFDGYYHFLNVPTEMDECYEAGGGKQDPRICSNCKEISHIESFIRTKTYCAEYLEKPVRAANKTKGFRKGELPVVKVVDLEGYPDNWSKKSRNYREKMNYICEECTIDLKHATYYLETHHVNGNKTDDVYSNLKCLCIKCHSEVDEYHIRNYSVGKNKKKLDDFMRLFHKQFQ